MQPMVTPQTTPTSEPTIRVKKADGSFVNVPLSSLHKSKKEETPKQPVSTPESAAPAAAPTVLAPSKKAPQRVAKNIASEKKPVDSLPTVAAPAALSTTTPVDDYFVDLAKAKEWTMSDHVSPLEESLDAAHTGSVLPDSRADEVSAILSKLQVPLDLSIQARAYALVQSRVKDIRSDAQVQSYATKPVDVGGLGMTEADAQHLIEMIHSQLHVRQESSIPKPRRTVMQPSRTVRAAPPADHRPPAAPLSPPTSQKSTSLTDIHPPASSPTTVPAVEKGEKASTPVMGPLEELGSMSLVEFRRLGKDPYTAVGLLERKVETIREESFLQYIKVKDAWLRAPLYQQYITSLKTALDKHTTLQDTLNASDLTADDITALASFSAKLRY